MREGLGTGIERLDLRRRGGFALLLQYAADHITAGGNAQRHSVGRRDTLQGHEYHQAFDLLDMVRLSLGAGMQACAVTHAQQRLPEGDHVAAEERLPSLAWRWFMGIETRLDGGIECIEQGALVFEVPVERRLLHAQLLRQGPRRQGINACMGIGFILGPAAGGLLREFGLMWPFALAAVLTVINLLLCLFVLPESRSVQPGTEKINPLAPLTSIAAFKGIGALLVAGGLFAIIGEIGGSVWVLYVEQRYGWQGISVGLSLTLFGLFHALAQALLVGPMTKRLGERGALLTGVFADMACYLALGLVTRGGIWILIPLLSVGGIAPSILMSVITKQVSEDRQGQLQGVIASL